MRIKNVAVAEDLSIEFAPGMNVVTGETGAGKSVLVDAFGVLCQIRADASLVRTGASAAEVTAEFEVRTGHPAARALDALEIARDEALLLRRIVTAQGRTRAFINDTSVSARTLAAVAGELIEISTQFEGQRLLAGDRHAQYLDAYARALAVRDRYLSLHRRCLERLAALREASDDRQRARDRAHLARSDLEGIEEFEPTPDDYAHHKEVLERNARVDAVHKACRELDDVLDASEVSARNALQVARKAALKLARQISEENRPEAFDPARYDGVLSEVSALLEGVAAVRGLYELDARAVTRATERIDRYEGLLARHGGTFEGLAAHVSLCEVALAACDECEANVVELEERCSSELVDLVNCARELSRARLGHATRLGQGVESELAYLGMHKARFECALVRSEADPLGPLALAARQFSDRLPPEWGADLARLGPEGLDSVAFLFSANEGLEPVALERVASGGEVSRVLLALKTLITDGSETSVCVFDEADAGMGGSVAMKVGAQIARFSRGRQSLVITHSPQVASFADTHFVVSKQVRSGRTVSGITQVAGAAQAAEVAGMLSGETVSEHSLAQARALIDAAVKKKREKVGADKPSGSRPRFSDLAG